MNSQTYPKIEKGLRKSQANTSKVGLIVTAMSTISTQLRRKPLQVSLYDSGKLSSLSTELSEPFINLIAIEGN